ncbi:MAG: hypothetical protein C0518_05505 [Opitutus sp.]|nr:hypothetical protein [Opitutus sp.]
MLPLLAQLSAQAIPSFIVFVVGGSATLFLINQALTFYKSHMKEQPTPATTYATKDEAKNLHGRIAREREEINRELTRIDAEQKALRNTLDLEIKDLNRRIDAVPGRTIQLLRETKDLI